MTRPTSTQHNLISTQQWLSLIGLAAILSVSISSPVLAGQPPSLVLQEGSSRILQFDRMQRVAVVQPTIADVVVSSVNELLVIGKTVGHTQLYVWDRAGRHQFSVSVTAAPYAQMLAKDLKHVLGGQFRYEVVDGRTLLVDGQVANSMELERVTKIITGLANEAEVINLVALENAELTPAQQKVKALRRMLGDKFDYIAWDENTVLITGHTGTQAELQRLDDIAQAASDEVKISNLTTVDPNQARPPVEQIATAIGPDYTVWALHGNTVVIEGEARNELAKKRVDSLLTAFADVKAINLVTVSDVPEVPLQAQRDLLQSALAEGLNVRVVQDKALVVEGLVADEAAAENVKKLVALFQPQTKVVNLTSVADPGRHQVLVRARIVEINRTDLDKLGINWGQIQSGEFRDQPFLFNVEGQVDNVYQFGAQLDVLVRNDLARILSEPNLLVNDGEEATMLVGGEIPIPVPQTGGGVSTVTIEYKPYGVELTIQPTIIPGTDQLKLQVVPSVSSLDYATQVAIGGLNLPALRKRSTDTTVTVHSGQSLIISGLVQRDQSENISKIPILGDLPVLGQLFRHKEFREAKTELVIVVTPEIMKGGPSGIPGATEPEVINPEEAMKQ